MYYEMQLLKVILLMQFYEMEDLQKYLIIL